MEKMNNIEIEEILNKKVGGLTIREMTAITFYQVVLKKLNDMPPHDTKVRELTLLCNQSMPSRILPDESKIDIILKLKQLGIEL